MEKHAIITMFVAGALVSIAINPFVFQLGEWAVRKRAVQTA